MIFYFKKPIRRFQVRPEVRRIINDTPIITPAVVLTITQKNLNPDGAYDTSAEEQKREYARLGITENEAIERIKNDEQFNTSEIRMLTEKDQKILEINKRKAKEAKEEALALEEKTKVI